MTCTSKLVLVAAVAAIGMSAPAFAQSFDPDVGTGNIVSFSVGPANVVAPVQHKRIAVLKVLHRSAAARQNGFNAFAMVPAGAGGSAFSAAANGGGSIGYNENLRRDQW
jgi:hypothetical protein